MRKLLFLFLLIPVLLHAQQTYWTTSPSGWTALSSPAFRFKANTPDSTNSLLIFNPLTGKYNQLYTSVEANKRFLRSADSLNYLTYWQFYHGPNTITGAWNFNGILSAQQINLNYNSGNADNGILFRPDLSVYSSGSFFIKQQDSSMMIYRRGLKRISDGYTYPDFQLIVPTFSGIDTIARKSNLGNYLPLIGGILSRNINDTTSVLTVNQGQGTGYIQQWMYGGSRKAAITIGGTFFTTAGMANLGTADNASINVSSGGTVIYRNKPGTGSALTITQRDTTATGNILSMSNDNVPNSIVAAFTRQGYLMAPAQQYATGAYSWLAHNETTNRFESIADAGASAEDITVVSRAVQLKDGADGYQRIRVKGTVSSQITELTTKAAAGPILIKDVIDLVASNGNRSTLILPDNTKIKFVGNGMLKNTYLYGKNLIIEAPRNKIFDNVQFFYYSAGGQQQNVSPSDVSKITINTASSCDFFDKANRVTHLASSADTINPIDVKPMHTKLASLPALTNSGGNWQLKIGSTIYFTLTNSGGNVVIPVSDKYIFFDSTTRLPLAGGAVVDPATVVGTYLSAYIKTARSTIYSELYPEWFGAKADGTTDNSPSLNQTLRVASVSGGGNRSGKISLIGSGGTYMSSGNIYLQDDIYINGNFATIKLINNASNHLFVHDNITMLDRCSIDNIYLDGNRANQTVALNPIYVGWTYGQPFYSQDASYSWDESSLNNVYVEFSHGTGMYVAVPGDMVLTNVNARYNDVDGFYWEKEHFKFVECLTWYNGRDGVHTNGGNHFSLIGGKNAHNGRNNLNFENAFQFQVDGVATIDAGTGTGYNVNIANCYGFQLNNIRCIGPSLAGIKVDSLCTKGSIVQFVSYSNTQDIINQSSTVAVIGNFGTAGGETNLFTANNSNINALNGLSISYNAANANPAVTIKQSNASSTGNILNLANSGGTVASVSKAGLINGTGLGIGTTSPVRLAEIVGGATTTETILAQLRSAGTGVGTASTLRFVNSTNATGTPAVSEIAAIRTNSSGAQDLIFRNSDNSGANVTEGMRLTSLGRLGIGTGATVTALLHLSAGAAGAGKAPFKFTAGTNLTTPEAGALEYDGTDLFYTTSTPTRRTVANIAGTQTFTNKTIAVSSNSITGTTGKVAQFNASTGNLEAGTISASALFANPMTAAGDGIYGGASGAPTRFAGNSTATTKFLTQANSSAPVYFDLFGTNNTWTNTQNFGIIQSSGSFSSANISQFQNTSPTGSGIQILAGDATHTAIQIQDYLSTGGSGANIFGDGHADFNGAIKSTQFKLSNLNTAPASSTDTGTLGEIRVTSGYIYVCVATNTWVRSALNTW